MLCLSKTHSIGTTSPDATLVPAVQHARGKYKARATASGKGGISLCVCRENR